MNGGINWRWLRNSRKLWSRKIMVVEAKTLLKILRSSWVFSCKYIKKYTKLLPGICRFWCDYSKISKPMFKDFGLAWQYQLRSLPLLAGGVKLATCTGHLIVPWRYWAIVFSFRDVAESKSLTKLDKSEGNLVVIVCTWNLYSWVWVQRLTVIFVTCLSGQCCAL